MSAVHLQLGSHLSDAKGVEFIVKFFLVLYICQIMRSSASPLFTHAISKFVATLYNFSP